MNATNDQLRPSLFHAEATLRAVEAFVRDFAEPGGPEQLAALLSGKRFRRAVLGEDPASVAAEHLVRPCLQALGYAAPASDPDPDRPRFRVHPAALPGTDDVAGSPSSDAIDFEIATAAPDADPRLAAVVAVVPPNAERPGTPKQPPATRGSGGPDAARSADGPATAAVRAYLADDAVGAHLRERGVPLAAGVATDGLRWSAWARSTAADGAVRQVDAVTVKGVVESVADALVFDADPPTRWRVHARRDVDGTLAALASADRLPERVAAAVGGGEV